MGKIKVSDYIVEFLTKKDVVHFFGYQGTMIAHFVDSVYQNDDAHNHVCYNEQGAAFAAVGYAKTKNETAVAYSTSGPGAANLISGIADAYFDSCPVIFFTGQLNTYEYFGIEHLRQNGFQEMDVVSIVKPITKYCCKVERAEDIRYILEKAYYVANEGRPGPVLIDLPMNIQREMIDIDAAEGFKSGYVSQSSKGGINAAVGSIIEELESASAPVFLLGNGIKNGSDTHRQIMEFAKRHSVPIITSMLGRDLLAYDSDLNMGHIGGGYGHRYANMIAYKKADLIVSFGCSLCKRQTAMKPEKFAEDAKIIRIDIDENELKRKIHADEISFNLDCSDVIKALSRDTAFQKKYDDWLEKCKTIRNKLQDFDDKCEERLPNKIIEKISDYIGYDSTICADVGQHQVWVSQSFKVKEKQRLLFSGGHGAMGFALPAAIGAHYATGKPVVAFCGDGAFQMNIQELQWVVRENIPITIIVLNNFSVGLIQQQQDDIFDGRYFASVAEWGYTVPDFKNVAKAYGLPSYSVRQPEEISKLFADIDMNRPSLVEVLLDVKSRAYPKTHFGEEMFNQKPYIPNTLMNEILDL